jgi:fructose-1,6-bisphosphatase/sedoheptulose 1,7-bisphosphatase-like protein
MVIPFSSKTKEEQKEEKYCVQLDKNLYEWLKEIAVNMGRNVDSLVTFMIWRYREIANVAAYVEIMKREQKDTENTKRGESS